MRSIAILAVSLALAACSSGEPGEPEAGDESGETPTPEFYAMGPGTYDIEGGEGVVYATTELRAGGTYVDSAEGSEVGGGRWTADGPNVCFDPEGDNEDQQERCWTNSPLKEDGSFITTRDDGSESYSVRPRPPE